MTMKLPSGDWIVPREFPSFLRGLKIYAHNNHFGLHLFVDNTKR